MKKADVEGSSEARYVWWFAIAWNVFFGYFWIAGPPGSIAKGTDVKYFYYILGAFQFAGVVLLYMAVRLSRGDDPGKRQAAFVNTGIVLSTAKSKALKTVAIAVAFAVVAGGFLYAILREYGVNADFSSGAVMAVGFLVAAGCVLAYMAVSSVLQITRFGVLKLNMDPSPASIGGQFGATVNMPVLFSMTNRFDVSLSCIDKVGRGALPVVFGGLGALIDMLRGRKEGSTLLWQERKTAHHGLVPSGTLLSFKFDVPVDLPESERLSTDYKYWVLCITGNVNGAKLDQQFVVDVKNTGSPVLSSVKEGGVTPELDGPMLGKALISRHGNSELKLFYPAMRNTWRAAISALKGAPWLLACLGVLAADSDGAALAVIPFLGVPVWYVFKALYYISNSLEVTVTRDALRTVRRLAGIVYDTREIKTSDISSLERKNVYQRGAPEKGRAQINIIAHSEKVQSVVIADGVHGFSEAMAIQKAVEGVIWKKL